MAGDYTIAGTLWQKHPDIRGKLTDLGQIVLVLWPPPQAPEVPYPENFYSYREDLIEQAALAQLRSQLDSLTPETYATDLYTPENPVTASDINQNAGETFTRAIGLARAAVAALSAWQDGNHYAANGEFTLAMQSYAQCQSSVADYCFAAGVGGLGGNTPLERIQSFLELLKNDDRYSPFWGVLRWRRILLSLLELSEEDRVKTIGNDGAYTSASAFLTACIPHTPSAESMLAPDSFFARIFAHTSDNLITRLHPLLIVMATVWVPLALGEANCQLRQFNAAISGLSDAVTNLTSADVPFRYLCEFIEIPFIRLLTIEALMGKADAEYKAGTTVDTQTFPDASTYHNLLAAQTYQEALTRISEDGHYTANVTQARDSLATSIQEAVQSKDTASLAFRTLGKNITVPTISGVTNAVPGLDHTLAPHQSIAQIISPDDPRTTNPRVYAIALLATAKLEQIKAGLNYLGYPPDYLPPWRFSFLLERGRYFAEHAKNGQRDYLNFLNSAEHEEFQEQSLAQNVEMEKSNIRIETARVDQVQDEVNASQASLTLANQQATDAQSRFDEVPQVRRTDASIRLRVVYLWSDLGGGRAVAQAGP